jgi:hypothetical protein
VLDDLLQHDGQSEGDEDLVGMRALVEVLDQAAFHNDADNGHHHDGHSIDKRHRPVDERGRDVRPNQS